MEIDTHFVKQVLWVLWACNKNNIRCYGSNEWTSFFLNSFSSGLPDPSETLSLDLSFWWEMNTHAP